jgi:hypothetical protein
LHGDFTFGMADVDQAYPTFDSLQDCERGSWYHNAPTKRYILRWTPSGASRFRLCATSSLAITDEVCDSDGSNQLPKFYAGTGYLDGAVRCCTPETAPSTAPIHAEFEPLGCEHLLWKATQGVNLSQYTNGSTVYTVVLGDQINKQVGGATFSLGYFVYDD